MKHITVLAVSILIMVSSIIAQPRQGPGMMNQGDSVTCPRCGMGYGTGMGMIGMFAPQILETDDGFIIIIGTKVIKYNNNLEIENETTIPLDSTEFAEMCKKMANIMAQCRKAFTDTTGN